MRIICENGFANSDERIGCSVKQDHGLCPHQRYCTVACEWQNTANIKDCDRRGKQMSKNYNNYNGYKPQERPEPIEKVEEVVKEAVVEEIKEAPIQKTVGVILAVGDTFTVVKIFNRANLRVEGILGEVGDEVEVEVR